MSDKTVFVYSLQGQRLVNTTPCKARKLLKSKRAKVINTTPFTIQLVRESKLYGALEEFLNQKD